MSSPNFPIKHGRYVGNGGAETIAIKLGFVPKYVEIFSVEGEAVYQERASKIKKRVAAGALTLLDDGVLPVEKDYENLGFEVSGSDDVLNKDTVEYFYRAY